MFKATLRNAYLKKRLALPQEEFDKRAIEMTEKLYARILELKIQDVFIFLPIDKKREFDCRPLAHKLWEVGITTHVPVSDFSTKSMKFARFGMSTSLIEKRYGIIEPVEPSYEEVEQAIVVTPLLIADSKLNRVGYGVGFYDRFFNNHNDIYKIGVSFFESIFEINDVDEFDIQLDQIIFPR